MGKRQRRRLRESSGEQERLESVRNRLINEGDLSFDQIRDLVWGALRTKYRPPDNVSVWPESGPWIEELFDDRIIFEMDGKLWQSSYAVAITDGASEITLGDPQEVKVEFVPITAEAMKIDLTGDSVDIKEAAVRPDGTVSLRIIAPGWGASGFYSPSVLERDGPKVFTTGLHMFWDHPTVTEETERPERSLRDLAGQLVSDARWVEEGVVGPGLYADAKVFAPFKDHLDELAPHIGISWRGWGEAVPGEADGRSGEIITQMTGAASVDFVTSPGAGGRVLQLFESLRNTTTPPKKEADTKEIKAMETKELESQIAEKDKALSEKDEQLAKREAEIKELRDNGNKSRVKEIVTGKVAEAKLPEPVTKRLERQLAEVCPTKEDGSLDVDAVTKKIDEAIDEERSILAELTKSGVVRDMGDSKVTESTDHEKELAEAFQGLGLSESAAKIAAAGRR